MNLIGSKVLVRDHQAGIHVGTLEGFDPSTKTATLTHARKVWYWRGAGSCHGIAAHGLDQESSKVAPLVQVVVSTNVVEVVACSDDGFASVMGAPEWMP